MKQNEATESGLEHQLRGLLQGVLALACFALIANPYYQMLFSDFSLAAFAQRALLTSITAAVVLLLHRLLFYRLPIRCFYGWWCWCRLQGCRLHHWGYLTAG